MQPGSVYDNPALALDERVAPYGVGLYRVHVTSGSCDQTIWVRLTGRSPLATVTGAVGSVAVVAGVALLGFGIARAIRRRRGILLGALGGAVVGIGALLLSQQFGWIGITRLEVITWVGVPALAGAAVTTMSAMISGGASTGAGTGVGAGAGAPPPSAPSPPPPSAPPPRADRKRAPAGSRPAGNPARPGRGG